MGKFIGTIEVTVDVLYFDEDLLLLDEWLLEDFIEKEMGDLVDESCIIGTGYGESYRMTLAERELLDSTGQTSALYIRMKPECDMRGEQFAQTLFLPYGWCAVRQLNGKWEAMEKPVIRKLG